MIRDEIPPEPVLPTRPSRRVERGELPNVAAREALNDVLRGHDLDLAEEALSRIGPEQISLLRRIAEESASTNVEPIVRQNAIALLARFLSVENLNLLVDLAQDDEDPRVRSHALLILARTGLQLAVPILGKALESRDLVEATAAAKGLTHLARALGTSTVQARMGAIRRKPVQQLFEQALQDAETKARGPAPKPRRTSRDRAESGG
jgi:HEAT repeat protein